MGLVLEESNRVSFSTSRKRIRLTPRLFVEI